MPRRSGARCRCAERLHEWPSALDHDRARCRIAGRALQPTLRAAAFVAASPARLGAACRRCWPASASPPSASRRWRPTRPTCRSAWSPKPSRPSRIDGAARSAGRPRAASSAAATSPAPATRPTACCAAWTSPTPPPRRSCAATDRAPRCSKAAAGKMVQAPHRRRRQAGRAGRPLPGRASRAARHPLHAPDHRSRDGDGFSAPQSRPRRCSRRSAWAAAPSAARCSPPPTRPRMPDPSPRSWPRSSPTDIDFHRELRQGDTFSVVYEALTADGEPITWNQAPAACWPPSSSTTARRTRRSGSRDARRQGRLLRLRRPEQAPRVPGQPDGVLARHLRLRDALPPDPADLARAPRRRLRRAHRHGGAQRRRRRRSSSPAGRTATATSCRSSTATTAARCTPT